MSSPIASLPQPTDPSAVADHRAEQKNTLKDYFSRNAASWDESRKWNHYYKLKLAEFCATLIPGGGSVLEIGSATGDLLGRVDAPGTGIDFSEEMVKIARLKYPTRSFVVDDVECLQLTKKHDVIVMSDLVDCLLDVWQAFRNLRQVSHRHTRVVITYHNHLWEPVIRVAEWLGIKNKQPVQNWLSPSALAEVLELNGFDTVRMGNCILLPIWIPLVSNWVNRYLAPLPVLNWFCFGRYLIARVREETPPADRSVVTVLVPCLNEAGNIGPLMKRLPTMGASMEVLFMDGGSTDGTIEAIENELAKPREGWKVRLLRQTGAKGKGPAVRQGFAEATGDILMILDADLSVPPEDLPKFYLALIEGRGELVNGTRLIYSMQAKAMQFANYIANHMFRIIFSWILGQPIRDTLCGTKVLYRRDYDRLAQARHFFGDFDPFGDFDLLFGAARLNLKIINVPVRYDARRYGTTKIHRWSHGWLLLKMCWYALWKLKLV